MTSLAFDCLEFVEGCADCVAEAAYLASIGSECTCAKTSGDPRFGTMCSLWGESRREDEEFHRISHQPELCDNCGALLSDRLGTDRLVLRPCRAGCCHEWCCPDCWTVRMSAGRIGCWACTRGRCPYRSKSVSRMRRMYRARRRYW